jgi:hypothetical protein
MTSHDQLGDTGKKTGVWLEEFAVPYYVFKDAVGLVLASFKGGERRDVIWLPARDEVAVDHDLAIHPLGPAIPEIGLERGPGRDPHRP